MANIDLSRQAEGVEQLLDLLTMNSGQGSDWHRREALRSISQLQELAPAVASLSRGTTYRVVMSRPVGGALNARADGLLDAFVKGEDGKIIVVARLQQASSALLSAATALAGFAMMVQISGQLERLQGAVDQVLAKLDADRLGQMAAALAFLAQSDGYQPEHRAPMLLSAVQSLSAVLGGLIIDVRQAILTTPEPPTWNISRALWDTSGDTARALDRAASSMQTVLLCLRTLGQAQCLLNREEGALRIMRHWFVEALSLPLSRAEHLARRLPIVKESERRDRFWIDTRQTLERAMEKVEEMLDQDRPLAVQFDATGADLMNLLNQAPTNDLNIPIERTPAKLRAEPEARSRR